MVGGQELRIKAGSVVLALGASRVVSGARVCSVCHRGYGEAGTRLGWCNLPTFAIGALVDVGRGNRLCAAAGVRSEVCRTFNSRYSQTTLL